MQLISGPGVGLPPPQYLYPSELTGAPPDISNAYVGLAPGDAIPLPSGRNLVQVGAYNVLQWLDSVTGIWRTWSSVRNAPMVVYGDGFTRRIANLTACPVGASIQNGGSNFVQSTAVITATGGGGQGGSTWQPVVGGALSITSVTVAGSGFTMAPLVFIPAPPNPGVQATAYATLSAGTVASVSLVNFGAGYGSAPTILILPNPTDPNFSSIKAATATCALTSAGAITAALCTNNGGTLATLTGLTLTAAGGSGSGATITPVVMQTVVANSIVAAGVGVGTPTAPPLLMSTGGGPVSVAAAANSNPSVDFGGYIPRPVLGYTTVVAASITAVSIVDGGLFVGAATAAYALGAGGGAVTTGPSIVFTMGGTPDGCLIQPL